MRQRTEKDSWLLRALRENEKSKERGRRVWRSVMWYAVNVYFSKLQDLLPLNPRIVVYYVLVWYVGLDLFTEKTKNKNKQPKKQVIIVICSV